MKKICLILLLAGLLAGCGTQQKTASIEHPPVPNKPSRMPSTPAILEAGQIFPHPDQGQEKPKKRKQTDTQSKGNPTQKDTRPRKDFHLQ